MDLFYTSDISLKKNAHTHIQTLNTSLCIACFSVFGICLLLRKYTDKTASYFRLCSSANK